MAITLQDFLSGLSNVAKPVLTGFGQGLLNPFTQAPQQIGNFLSNPQNLAGAGLIGAGLLQGEEPGYLTESRQFLRDYAVNPQSAASALVSQLGPIQAEYEPLLAQNRTNLLNEIQQRTIAGLPGSLTPAMGGPEIAAIRSGVTDILAPQERAFFADQASNLLRSRLGAAESILQTSKPDQLGQILAALGANLIGNDGASQTTGPGGQGSIATGQGAASLLGGDPVSQVAKLLQSGNMSGLTQLLASGALAGMPFPFGIQASTPAGQLVQQAINAGLVESPAAQLVGGGTSASTPGVAGGAAGFQGLLGPAGTSSAAALTAAAASALGSGYVGYKVGSAIGDAIEKPGSSATTVKTTVGGAAAGAASGAAVGAIIGDGPGAVIGAIVGGLAGGFGGSGAERRREDANIAYETQLTGQERPQVLATAKQFFDNGAAFENSARPFISSTEAALEGMKQSGDPRLTSLLNEARTLLGGTFGSSTGAPLAPGVLPPMASLMEVLMNNGARGQVYSPALSSNPESRYSLLLSPESGKFFPGKDFLLKDMEHANKAQVLFEKFANLARGG